ncbi:MAG: glycoside hydrolase family 18 protein [Bacteroidales bacterium]|nr:glycoside hydrolase family 18 protein [Bacteroidales bacterium]
MEIKKTSIIYKLLMNNKLIKYLYFFLIQFCLVSCLVNNEESNYEFNSEPPELYKPLRKPMLAAYLHIGTRKIEPEKINLYGVDLINIAFTKITNNKIQLLYPNHSEEFKKVKEIKKNNPGLRVLVSVGGYGTSDQFSKMASTKSNRTIFVKDVVNFLKRYSFDGIDVDWEFPGMNKNTRDFERENFTLLLTELKNELDSASRQDGKKYLLTIAAGAFDAYLSYTEPQKITPLVDYFFVMTYDFVGQWNKTTGHHTNLYKSILKPYGYSVDRIVKKYISCGIPSDKIIVGCAAYGRQWNDVDSSETGLFVKGKGIGSISYKKILELENSPNFKKGWDKSAFAPYLYSPKNKIFITYDNSHSIRRKVDYVDIHSLGGIMYWEYYSDGDLKLKNSLVDEIRINRGEVLIPQIMQISNIKNR